MLKNVESKYLLLAIYFLPVFMISKCNFFQNIHTFYGQTQWALNIFDNWDAISNSFATRNLVELFLFFFIWSGFLIFLISWWTFAYDLKLMTFNVFQCWFRLIVMCIAYVVYSCFFAHFYCFCCEMSLHDIFLHFIMTAWYLSPYLFYC